MIDKKILWFNKIKDLEIICKKAKEAFEDKKQLEEALNQKAGMADFFIRTENYNAIIVVIDNKVKGEK